MPLPPLIVTSFLYQNAAGTYTSVRLGISRDHFLLTRMTLKCNMLWLFKRKAKTGSCEDTEFGQFSSVTHRRNRSQTQHESNHCCFTLHALCIVWLITAPSHIPFLDSDFSTTPFPRLSTHHHDSLFLHFSPLHRIL